MSNTPTPLTQADRLEIIATLIDVRDRFDLAGELLAGIHISHALDCIDPKDPLNREGSRHGG